VPLELSELAAGLPFAASFAMAGGISALREGRRRSALNEAMHELRRPLQAMALVTPTSPRRIDAFESSLQLAAVAVDRLDREINGRQAPQRTDTVHLQELVESAAARWRQRAALEQRALRLNWDAGQPHLYGDAVQLMQLLDNLISNGFEHGSGEVTIEAKRVERAVRLVVANENRPRSAGSRRTTLTLKARLAGRSRHGHGLRIVRRVAAESGGCFRVRRRGARYEALLELPVAGELR
jgi:signal transduction histidine kinase